MKVPCRLLKTRNIFLSQNITRDHWAAGQNTWRRAQASLLLYCLWVKNGTRAANRLRRPWRLRIRRTVSFMSVCPRRVDTMPASLRRESVRSESAVRRTTLSSLALHFTGRPERFQSATDPVSIKRFQVFVRVERLTVQLNSSRIDSIITIFICNFLIIIIAIRLVQNFFLKKLFIKKS